MKARYDAKKIMQDEISKEVIRVSDQYAKDYDATVLWVLHRMTGWGRIRLKRFWDMYVKEHKRLKDRYSMGRSDIPWICSELLEEIGVDLDKWYEEIENNPDFHDYIDG